MLEQLEIRERQYRVASALLGNLHGADAHGREAHAGAIVQLNMGEGKTRVILPMLVLALAGQGVAQGAGGAKMVRLNFLDTQLKDAVEYLQGTLTGAISHPCSQPVCCLPACTALDECCLSRRGTLCVAASCV